MKVLYTADLHIRLGQKNIPTDWALKRYDILWSELNRVYYKYNCEAEIHGGDIFDKLPSLEELAVYFDYIGSITNPVFIYDGNHEATRKNHTFMHYLKGVLENINSKAYVFTKPETIEELGDFIPYTHIKNKNLAKYKKSNIAYTHVRGEIPPHVTPEIDLTELDAWDTVFAGDLHAHSNTQRNIVYPGSPTTVTFHRNKVKTGVIVLDTKTAEWEWVEITVPQLIRKTIEDPEEMVKTDYDHTIYEIVGDMVDLAKVNKDSDILDKKIVKYESEATLDLQGLSLEEEVYIYLLDIVQLDNDKIEEVLQVYNDNIKGTELE